MIRVSLARSYEWSVFMSGPLEDAADDYVADLAVCTGSALCNMGTPAIMSRLEEIAEELCSSCSPT